MKPEFIIDLSEGAESPLEAPHILSVLDPSEGFHLSKKPKGSDPFGLLLVSRKIFLLTGNWLSMARNHFQFEG